MQSKKAYINIPDFNSDDFFKYSFGITQINGAKPEKIFLSFSKQEAQYIIGQPFHHSQQILRENDKEVRVQLEVYVTQELIMTILSYCAAFEVMEPINFREKVQSLINEMLVKCK